MSALLLVTLVLRLVRASWWKVLVLAHWWVELGLVPLVGRAMSRGVFIGGCELSVALSTLSADGWGCFPILLVVWPEAFHHWSLQAVG